MKVHITKTVEMHPTVMFQAMTSPTRWRALLCRMVALSAFTSRT